MANLYGVANAPGLPTLMGGANFVGGICAAGTYTLIGTCPALIAPSQGYFYAQVLMTIQMAFGATLPASVFFAVSIGAGSATNAVGLGQYGFTISGSNNIAVATYTPVSQTAWQGAGSTVGLWVQPGGQSVTVETTSSALVTLFRAPDQ